MHSHHRARGTILFEVFCALSLAASFVVASDQTGSPALLGSASIFGLFALYWSFGLFARNPVAEAAQPPAEPLVALAEARQADVEIAVRPPILPRETEIATEPEGVAAAAKKRPARKAKKAAAAVAPVIEQSEPAALAEPVYDGPPLEQLFDPQPFVRQPRAFGRKARGPRPVQVA